MMVHDLMRVLPGAFTKGPDRTFSALKADSACISAGDAFIALKGSITDGHLFIQKALGAGASVIICNKESSQDILSATVIYVPDTKKALTIILPVLYPEASQVTLVGITGTNGKTTTTYLIESVLGHAGMNPGVMGTINTRYPGFEIPSPVTTPGPIDLFKMLGEMRFAGVKACIMEVSSHALDQDRIAGLAFDYAVFTNLSQDHLDYHKDMESYFIAKKKLFNHYLRGRAIVNADDPYGRSISEAILDPITYGMREPALIHPLDMSSTSQGLSLNLATPSGEFTIRSRLRGEMNAYNIMASVGVCQAMGIDSDRIVSGIEAVQVVPGRMEGVENSYGLNIIVDFAHTPDALETALRSARQFTKGRLLTVFGCGGDRDRTKRPIMGSIASKLSDLAIVTSDNPRTEDPLTIIEDILKGVGDRAKIAVESDRAAAIKQAIVSMAADDCLLIAGKGHENYQIIGTKKRAFDDITCVRQCLKEVYGQ
jgi:UDP-N-acetylmuramoyl-L-alanyl-D-glutamate--2,6-diaminopimelate ligase